MKLRKNGRSTTSFHWIGRCLKGKARDRRHENVKYYSAFEYGTIQGKIGDYVLISNVDAVDPDTVEGCDIAKILKLYETAECEEPYRAVVQWFSRPQQLPKKFSSHKMPFAPFDYDCEVVEDMRNFDSDVNIETFFSKCEVVQAMPEEEPKEVVNSYSYENSLPTFVVRFQFWASKGKQGIEILPIPLRDDSCGIALDSECDDANSSIIRTRRLNTNSDSHQCQENEASDTSDGRSPKRPGSPEVPIKSGEPRLRYVLLSNERKISREKSMWSDRPIKAKLTSLSNSEEMKNEANISKSTRHECNINRSFNMENSQTKNGLKSSKKISSDLKFPMEKSVSAKTEITKLKTKSEACLKDKDISGLLEDYLEEENSRSDVESVTENEKNIMEMNLNCESLIKHDLPKVYMKSKKIPVENSVYFVESDKNLVEPLTSTTCGHVDIDEKFASLSSTDTRTKKRKHKLELDADVKLGELQTATGHVEASTTPLMKRTIAATSPKSLSAKKRLQLLSQVSHGCFGLTEPDKSVGPMTIPLSPLEEARACLHVSSVPSCLPCREQEFASIYSFVEDKILDGAGGCMYICGVPGTGKTAVVHEVVRQLQEASSKGEIPTFEFGEVNGMRVTEPRRAYSEVLRVLTGRVGVGPEEARELLDQRFLRPAPRRLPTLLLIDELDLLWNRRQDVVYNLMDWPNRSQSRLIVITIANTMDLPERILMGRVSSRLGLTRLTFHPYTFQQLEQIVLSRMKGLKAFDPDAVQLVARKVAAVSGDARRALDICRRSTEIAEWKLDDEHKNEKSPMLRKIPKKAQNIVVTMKHVHQAISEMISSSKAKAIQCCSRLEKLFLQAVASEVERTGIEEAAFDRVHSVVGTLCTYNGFRRPTVSECMNICSRLGSLRLILTEATSRADVLQRIMLNVDVDSVHYALKVFNQ